MNADLEIATKAELVAMLIDIYRQEQAMVLAHPHLVCTECEQRLAEPGSDMCYECLDDLEEEW